MNLDQALGTFLEESRELLAQMENILLAAEGGATRPDDLNALFRCAHTIKGSAGLFGLDAVVSFTHGVESLLDRLRHGELAFDPTLCALLLECRDHIGGLVDDSSEDKVAFQMMGAVLNQRLQAYFQPSARADSAPAAMDPTPQAGETPEGKALDEEAPWHLSLHFRPDVLRHGMDPLAVIHYLGRCGDIGHLETRDQRLPDWTAFDPESCYLDFEVDLDGRASRADIESAFDFIRDDVEIDLCPPERRARAPEAALPHKETTGSGTQGTQTALVPLGKVCHGEEKKLREGRSLKVPSERLDQLIDLVGELVIAGAATQLQALRSLVPELRESTANLLRLIEDIRDTTLKLRMVPMGEVFTRFPRVVRDVARDLGKDIDLQISGAETELDKSMVEKIGDPLTHLVRNAIDHGIEPEVARLARGKPGRGSLRLNAHHESGCIVIEVADDGGGLDSDKILAKARALGLVAPEQNLSRQEIFRLILEPGFSTAERVTNLSGRGVGMDVVRSSIDALRGTLDIESVPGQGTTMRICLPLTLAIIDGFQVALGGNVYIIPLDMVVECIELPAGIPSDYLNLRNEVLPLVRLGQLFELGPGAARQNVVVVRAGERKAGLVVDALLGEFQTVIKPLSRIFERLRGISGSTILGSGQVALIVDVPSLVHLAATAEAQSVSSAFLPLGIH